MVKFLFRTGVLSVTSGCHYPKFLKYRIYRTCLKKKKCTVMVNKENYYRYYKGHTTWLSLISRHFAKNIWFGMTLHHAHAYYICIVCAKYQKASVKTLVQVDFLMYALSKHKQNPYLIGNRKKWLSSQSYQKLVFWHQTSSHNVQCVYIV